MMSIWTESQVMVECDVCGTTTAEAYLTQNHMKTLCRKEGWSFGKLVKCPKCERIGEKE
uniref:Uncharacterized protein n=1 Tax=viral metagenome TaxID=1070528 RepID=A0A6M3LGZ4_9ZZZZ